MKSLTILATLVFFMSRAQSGFEFMVLFAVLAFALLAVSYYFYNNFQTQSRVFQARVAVDKLAQAGDAVAAQGVGSTKTVAVYFPSGLINARALSRAVVLTVAGSDGAPTDVVAVMLANVTPVQFPLAENRYTFTVTFNSTGNVSMSV